MTRLGQAAFHEGKRVRLMGCTPLAHPLKLRCNAQSHADFPRQTFCKPLLIRCFSDQTKPPR